MSHAEIILLWLTIFTYAGAFCAQLLGFMSQRARLQTFGLIVLWAAMVLHTAVGIARWMAAGHPPVTDAYELNLTGVWLTMLVFLVFQSLGKAHRVIGLVVTAVAFLVLGHSLLSRTDPGPMGPAYDSPWLAIHVIFAWLSFGCYVIATGAALFLLLKHGLPDSNAIARVPEPQVLDIASYRFIILGLVNHAVMLVSGAIWARKLWGRYWSWDALETWSLISFLFYAFYLHARAFIGWKMRKAAWLALLGLIVVAISFWAVEWFSPSIHPGP